MQKHGLLKLLQQFRKDQLRTPRAKREEEYHERTLGTRSENE
jgi:hypothetical protein